MQTVTLDKAQTALLDLVDAAISGETVLITKGNQQVQLVPVLQPTQRPLFGSARGLVWMADDFDAPLTDFNEYMQ